MDKGNQSRGQRGFLQQYSLVLALLALCTILSLSSPAFLTGRNILIVFRQISINAVLAIGVTYVILAGGIDLSLGSVVALAGVLSATFAHPETYPLFVPVLVGLVAGVLVGATNGLIITRCRVAPFIVTLGMMTIARGAALVLSDGRPVSDLSEAFNFIGGGDFVGIPVPILILAGVFVVSYLVLSKTTFGRYVYAVGGNEEAARASGIRVRRVKMAAYSICGGLAGLAGIIQAARISTGQPNAGVSYELDAIAAVVIGGTSLSGGVGGVGGTVLGALIIGVINNGLDLLNVSSYYQQIVKGLIIIGAVTLDREKVSRRTMLIIMFLALAVVAAFTLRSIGHKKADIVIGVSLLNVSNEFIVNIQEAIEAKAGELDVRVIINDAQRSAERQTQQVETFIANGVDAIILNPCEVEASSPAVDKALSAGIPIINVNSETRAEPTAFVGSRDEESAEIAINYLAERLEGTGTIVMMHGYPGQAAEVKRTQGALNMLQQYPGLQLLAEQTANWSREEGMALMENWLQAYPGQINGVFAQNDEMGMGALKALQAAGVKDRVVLVSVDAIADALHAVKAGHLDATVFQNAQAQGATAVEIAVRIVNGRAYEKETFIPFELVTQTNVDQYRD
jgi:ribose/xylose/arabinose/galactoside ABC-type transport system permease subunit/ABC-type sugar transport system substrate-binding protein